MSTGQSNAHPASRTLVIICSIASCLLSVVWNEFRDWQSRQTSERTSAISQFEALGVQYNSNALRFNTKTVRTHTPDESTRNTLIENMAAQDAVLLRLKVYLTASEQTEIERYRDELTETRKDLLAVRNFDTLKPFLESGGTLVDHRERIDAQLAHIKTAYVLPFTKVRIGAAGDP